MSISPIEFRNSLSVKLPGMLPQNDNDEFKRMLLIGLIAAALLEGSKKENLERRIRKMEELNEQRKKTEQGLVAERSKQMQAQKNVKIPDKEIKILTSRLEKIKQQEDLCRFVLIEPYGRLMHITTKRLKPSHSKKREHNKTWKQRRMQSKKLHNRRQAVHNIEGIEYQRLESFYKKLTGTYPDLFELLNSFSVEPGIKNLLTNYREKSLTYDQARKVVENYLKAVIASQNNGVIGNIDFIKFVPKEKSAER